MSLEKISIHIFYFFIDFFSSFCILSCMNFFILIVLNIWKYLKHFFHSLCCMFILLMVTLAVQLFSMMWPTYLFLLLSLSLLGVILKNHCRDLCQGAYYSFFPRVLCDFKSYIQVFNTFWVNCGVWCKIVVPFYFFACDWPVSQRPFIEKNFFFPLYTWLLCCKFIGHIFMGLFLGSCSVPLIHVSTAVASMLIPVYVVIMLYFQQ